MNQNNRIFDGLGRVMNEAAGVADGDTVPAIATPDSCCVAAVAT